jgi:hypothetical protein
VDLRSIQNYFGGWRRGQWPCHSVWVPPFLLSSMCGPDLTTIVELGSVLGTCMHFFFRTSHWKWSCKTYHEVKYLKIHRVGIGLECIRIFAVSLLSFSVLLDFWSQKCFGALTGCSRFTGSFGTFGWYWWHFPSCGTGRFVFSSVSLLKWCWMGELVGLSWKTSLCVQGCVWQIFTVTGFWFFDPVWKVFLYSP